MATTSPTPPTATTPLRVPGVIQPTVTDSTTSSVTAGPDVTVTGTLAALNDTVAVALSGHNGAGFFLPAASTLNGTLSPELSFDGGVSYVATYFIKDALGNIGTWTQTQVANVVPLNLAIVVLPGATHARVRVSIYGAGSGSASIVATMIAATLNPAVTIDGTIPVGVTNLGATEPTSGSFISLKGRASAAMAGTDFGLVTRPLPAGANLSTFGGSTFGFPPVSPLRLGGTPFTLRAAGTLTPPIVTATQPPQPVLTFSGVIPGATINNYVLDSVVIQVTGPASVVASPLARVVKRHVLYASTQTAAPAAGAVPTGAVLAYTSAPNASSTFQYKYVAVDIWGNEGNISAASANVVPGANQGVTVTMPAVPAGAAGYNVYRTVTGPGATWFFLGRTNTTTFRDITPDSALTLAAGTIGTWGTLPTIETVNAPMELVIEKFVAMTGTAPVIISTKTFPGTRDNNRVVTIAPGAAVGRYRIPGEVESKAFLTTPTIVTALARDIDANYTYGGTTQINASFGDLAVNSFNQSDSGMGGTFVVWGHELVGVTDAPVYTTYNGVAQVDAGLTDGTTLTMKWTAPPVFAVADEIAVEIGDSATAASTAIAVYVSGRYF